MSDLVKPLSTLLKSKNLKLVTAESCTGGLIASMLTRRAGSSAIFERGYVTYSNDAKIENLGVSKETLKTHGAVSQQTAREMAKGALKNSRANIAISVTGIAGPDGGSAEKPVGLVYFGFAITEKEPMTRKCTFDGTREDIQNAAAEFALKTLIEILS